MTGVNLTVAGCGDAFGSGGRLNTCFYVKAGEQAFLIDCGASSIAGLKRNGIDINSIDTILISHFHGDHFGGLPFLLLEFAVYGRTAPVTIVSPPGCRERVSQLLSVLYPGSRVLERLDIEFKEYLPFETIETAYLSVRAFPVVHSEEALPHGLRVCAGDKIISYSGDTEWTDNLIPLSADADLFICECNFFGLQVKGHMYYQLLKTKVSELSCKQILLTHFDNEMLSNIGLVEMECATEGQTYTF